MSSDFKHNRKSIRLPGYDYSLPGWYYITICTKDREHIFGEIIDGVMNLNRYGELIEKEIQITETIRPNILIDSYCIMPNHVHFIVNIVEKYVGVHCNEPLQNIENYGKSTKNSIPTIIKLIKSTTTKQINIIRNTPGKAIWQRNYFEHIIRNDAELQEIRWYIRKNPLNWQNDVYGNI